MTDHRFDHTLYDELLALGRPTPTHPRMSLQDRAKIFSPFAALRGHGDAVEAMQQRRMQQRRCDKIQLTEYEAESISQTLASLSKHDTIHITYFVYDPGPDGSGGIAEGEYRSVPGTLLKIDSAYQVLRISSENAVGWVDIRFSDILEIQKNH